MKDLIIAGVEVIRDEAGRYNLNALHRASGGNPIHAPSQWLRLKGTKKLIDQLESETMQKCTFTIEGVGGGTFAHELLIISYAGWISPAFQLRVNQAFLDMNKKDQDLSLPANYIEALEALVKSEKEKMQVEKQLEEAKPAIEFVDKYVDSSNLQSFRQVCKLLDAKENVFRAFLSENKIMYKLGREWMPYSQHLDAGRFEVKTGINRTNGATYSTAYFTPKGVEWIAGLWVRHNLKNEVFNFG